MPAFCIPRHLISKLKDSALKGEVDISKLYEMASAERREFFAKHTDAELGKFINTKFEQAMLSKQKDALTEWAKSVFDPQMKNKEAAKTIIDKINNLDDLGVLTPETEKAFLEDLVADKLGVGVTTKQVEIIKEKANKISTAQNIVGDDLGNPSKLQENLDFWKSKKEMDDYLASLAPANRLKVATGTIGRGMMLASVKSPILNIGSNFEVGATEAISRRLASGQWRGANNKLAFDYIKMANNIYQQTGYDISRMQSISDTGVSGERVLGETTHAQGKGVVRKVGRVVEDIVFKQLMGAPDVAFSSAHFADSVNLNSLKMAKGNKAQASSMMSDAMRLTPQTVEGEILRAQGIMDAQVATWTNTSWASKVSERIRGILNEVSGDARVGDFVLPFIKTPANVIATGMDYGGLGFVKAAVKTVNVLRSGDIKEPQQMQSIARDLARAGLGLTGAAIISSYLNDDDFVGAYDPARRQIEQLRNSNTNSIRLKGKWISTDWLGPLAVPITAMMYARKYGKGAGGKAFQFGKGLLSSVEQIPGIEDIAEFVKSQSRKKMTAGETAVEAKNYIIDETSSRMTPSLMSDVARASDTYERQGGKGWSGVKNKVPFLREQSPIKRNIFAEPLKTESALSTILFGKRVKSDKETPLVKELNRLQTNTDKPLNFTDFDKSSSKKLAKFREKIGADKYEEAKIKYGQELKRRIESTISKDSYKKLTDEAQIKDINGIDSKVIDDIFDQYNFRYQKDKTSPFRNSGASQ